MDFDRPSSKPFSQSFHNPNYKLGLSQRRVAHSNLKSWILKLQLLIDEGPNFHRIAPPSMQTNSDHDKPGHRHHRLPVGEYSNYSAEAVFTLLRYCFGSVWPPASSLSTQVHA